MKNSSNRYYLNNKEITNKPFSWEDKGSFVFTDLCYCRQKNSVYVSIIVNARPT